MMDIADITTCECDDRPPVKGLGNDISHEGLRYSRCSSVASVPNGSDMGIFLTSLQDDLHGVLDEVALDSFLQTKVKPLLEKLHQQANNVVVSYNDKDEKERKMYQQSRHVLLHVPTLQELLLKLGFSKNMEDLQSYLISTDRTCLLSDNEALKLELNDAQCRHQTVVSGLHFSFQSAEHENKGTQHSLHQSIRHHQDRVQSMEQKLKEYERQVISLQQIILESDNKAQILQKTLCTSTGTLQSAQQELEESKQKGLDLQAAHQASQDSNQYLRRNLLCAEDLAESLRQSVSNLEQEIELHQKKRASEGERVKSMSQRLDAAEEKVSSLQHSLKTSEENISSLRQTLRASEEKVVSFEHSQRATEEKCHSLQQKVNLAVEEVQMTQGSLRVAEDKAKRLKVALGTVEEKARALQDKLVTSESHVRSTTAQWQALVQGKQEQEERMQGLVHSLASREEEHRSRAKRLENDLGVAKGRVVLLHDSVSTLESHHAQEMARLQHKLLKANNKATATEKELRAHIVELNTKLMKTQAISNRELESVTVYEKELQDVIKDLNQELNFEREEKEGFLQSLRMRQKDLAEVQHHLQADLLKCSHSSEQGRGHFSQRKAEQKEELDTLTAELRSGNRDDVLTKSAKVHGLHSHEHQGSKGLRDSFPYRSSRSAGTRRDRTPSASTSTSSVSTMPPSPWCHGRPAYKDGHVETSCPTKLEDTDRLQNLVTMQKKLRAL